MTEIKAVAGKRQPSFISEIRFSITAKVLQKVCTINERVEFLKNDGSTVVTFRIGNSRYDSN